MKVYLCAQQSSMDFAETREWESCCMWKHAPERQTDPDHCVVCGSATEYTKDTPTGERFGYVEGGRKLCQNCYQALYRKGRGCHG